MDKKKLARIVKAAFTGVEAFTLNEDSLKNSSYPMELEQRLRESHIYFEPRDKNNIPMKDIAGQGAHYNPTRIADYALAHFNRFMRSGNARSRELFLRMADWFANFEDGIWYYNFDHLELKKPWISGMAQGQGISVLLRAHELTGDSKYLDIAVKAVEPLTKAIDEGGVRSMIDDKYPFIEEYPFRKPHHVLNGFMFALIGLVELTEIRPDIEEQVGLAELLNTLITQHQRWDLGFWTTYDLSKSGELLSSVSVHYHRVHTTQMQFLAEKRNNDQLREIASRWEKYYQSMGCRLRGVWGLLRYRLSQRRKKSD